MYFPQGGWSQPIIRPNFPQKPHKNEANSSADVYPKFVDPPLIKIDYLHLSSDAFLLFFSLIWWVKTFKIGDPLVFASILRVENVF